MGKRVVIVTGGAQGIGAAIVEKFLQNEFLVVCVDKNKEALESISGKENLHPIMASIDEETEVKNLFDKTMKQFGQIDAVVNCAGIIKDKVIWKMSLSEFEQVINVNLKGTWLMCREAAIVMRKSEHGRIVNIGSRAWLGNPGQTNYSASKAGVVGLTRSLALELGPKNIMVNTVAPGLIETPLTQSLPEEIQEKLINAQPTRKMGTPENVADTVFFLASESNTFITGQVIYVDGGKSIGAGI